MDAALGRLLGRGVIIERGSQLMLPRPDEDRARAPNESERAAQIAELLRLRAPRDRKSGGCGKSVSVRVDQGGRPLIKKKKHIITAGNYGNEHIRETASR